MQQPDVELRPSSSADAGLFYSATEQTMRGFVEQTWGRWDEERVRRESLEGCLSPNAHVVQLGGTDIGVLSVTREETHFLLERLYLLPQFQRLGIGTSLLRSLLVRAKAEQVPLRLTVLAVNPAREFYAKLGFVVTAVTPERVHMEAAVT